MEWDERFGGGLGGREGVWLAIFEIAILGGKGLGVGRGGDGEEGRRDDWFEDEERVCDRWWEGGRVEEG